MSQQNLEFNILPFDWPKGNIILYINKEAQTKACRLHKRQFPYDIETYLPGVLQSGQSFIATSFDRPTEGFFPIVIDPRTDNPELVKRYFNRKIFDYFKYKCKNIVRTGSSNENEVWIPAGKLETHDYYVFERFLLQVHLRTVSDGPELLVCFNKESKVLKQSVAEIIGLVPPSKIGNVFVDHCIKPYLDYALEDETDFGKAYPVLNQALWKTLRLVAPSAEEDNRYKKHYKYIKGFCLKFLQTEGFRSIIPINNQFLQVDPQLAVCTHPGVHDPGSQQGIEKGSQNDITMLKPHKKSPHTHIHMFFVAHKEHEHLVEKVKTYFCKGLDWFPGLSKFAQLNIYPQKELDIIFHRKDNPLPEINHELEANAFHWETEITYIAVYISPYTKDDPDAERRAIFYKVKEAFLERRIVSQALTAAKLNDPNIKYVYHLPNIAVAMLAKLGGIPWRLPVPVKKELIVGIGAFRQKVDGVLYITAVTCFNNEGRFNYFERFLKHQVRKLAGYISNTIRMYADAHDFPSRLIIHFYRRLSRQELEPIQIAIENLQFSVPIPIFIISISKTETDDVLVFDKDSTDLMPYSGTIVRVRENRYLLYNNTRYANGSLDKESGFPFPIQLEIDCTDKKELENREVMFELMSQVYQFSRMYWRGPRLQNMPVTVKYPEMIAATLPYFREGRIPEFGRRSLWFL